MCEPGRDADAELTRADLLAVMAWVIEHYCGTGVVEIEEWETWDRGPKVTIRRTEQLITIRRQ